MAERAHPKDPGFKRKLFGLIENPYRKKFFERYKFCNKYIKKKVVLDIPCGVGWGTSLLKNANYVIGVDISREAIQYAQEYYGNNKRKFIVSDMKSIPLIDNSIDVALCLEGIEHVSREVGRIFMIELKRVIKKNGLLIITCPIIDEFGKSTNNPFHLYEYPEKEFIELLSCFFRILNLDWIKGPEGPEYRAVLSNVKAI